MEVISKKPEEIVSAASEMRKEGYRLVVITCTNAENDYDITYSFDKQHTLKHFRLTVPEDTVIPSIGSSYSGAFVYENEIHDLYGFSFTDMSLDYKGTFIRTSIPFPFKKKVADPPKVTKVNSEEESS